MPMLIKCLHRTPAVVVILLAIGWIVGDVECIKNGVEQHQDVVVLVDDGVFDDAASTISQIGRVEG